MKKMSGIIVAMTTPFNSENKVDISALAQTTDMLVNKGVDCLFPGGTTSEMLRLSLDERKVVAETVIDTVNKRLPVFMQVGATTTEETISLAQHAYEIGADGIGLLTPYFFATTEEEMVTYFTDVAQSLPNDFPIYLYSIPQYSANIISVEVIKRVISCCPNVVGIKFSLADMDTTLDYINISADFSVVHGYDKMALGLLTAGCDGIVSGCACSIPEPLVNVYNAYKKGDLILAEKWQKVATELSEILLSGANLAYFKAASYFVGQSGGHMRKPLLDLTIEERESLFKHLANLCQAAGIEINNQLEGV